MSLSVSPHIYRGKNIISREGDFENSDNSAQNYYYFPEFRVVVSQYKDLRSKPADLDVFVRQQKKLAAQLMKVLPILIINSTMLNKLRM